MKNKTNRALAIVIVATMSVATALALNPISVQAEEVEAIQYVAEANDQIEVTPLAEETNVQVEESSYSVYEQLAEQSEEQPEVEIGMEPEAVAIEAEPVVIEAHAITQAGPEQIAATRHQDFDEFEGLIDELIELREQLEDTLQWLLDSCPAWLASLTAEQQQSFQDFKNEIKLAIEVIDEWIELHEFFLEGLEVLDWDWDVFLAILLEEFGLESWEDIMNALESDLKIIDHLVNVVTPNNKVVANSPPPGGWGRPATCPCNVPPEESPPAPSAPPAPPAVTSVQNLYTAPQTGDTAPASLPFLGAMLSLFILSGGALIKKKSK